MHKTENTSGKEFCHRLLKPCRQNETKNEEVTKHWIKWKGQTQRGLWWHPCVDVPWAVLMKHKSANVQPSCYIIIKT